MVHKALVPPRTLRGGQGQRDHLGAAEPTRLAAPLPLQLAPLTIGRAWRAWLATGAPIASRHMRRTEGSDCHLHASPCTHRQASVPACFVACHRLRTPVGTAAAWKPLPPVRAK